MINEYANNLASILAPYFPGLDQSFPFGLDLIVPGVGATGVGLGSSDGLSSIALSDTLASINAFGSGGFQVQTGFGANGFLMDPTGAISLYNGNIGEVLLAADGTGQLVTPTSWTFLDVLSAPLLTVDAANARVESAIDFYLGNLRIGSHSSSKGPVTVGAADSGGAGFRMVITPN